MKAFRLQNCIHDRKADFFQREYVSRLSDNLIFLQLLIILANFDCKKYGLVPHQKFYIKLCWLDCTTFKLIKKAVKLVIMYHFRLHRIKKSLLAFALFCFTVVRKFFPLPFVFLKIIRYLVSVVWYLETQLCLRLMTMYEENNTKWKNDFVQSLLPKS